MQNEIRSRFSFLMHWHCLGLKAKLFTCPWLLNVHSQHELATTGFFKPGSGIAWLAWVWSHHSAQDPSHACVRTDRPVKQTNKQTNKQKHKQTNKQTNKQTPQQTNKQTLKQATPPSYTANNNKYSEFGNLNLHKTQGNSYHLIQTDDETLITAFW